jgi:hypothetical protein
VTVPNGKLETFGRLAHGLDPWGLIVSTIGTVEAAIFDAAGRLSTTLRAAKGDYFVLFSAFGAGAKTTIPETADDTRMNPRGGLLFGKFKNCLSPLTAGRLTVPESDVPGSCAHTGCQAIHQQLSGTREKY